MFKRKKINKRSPKSNAFKEPKEYHEGNKIFTLAIVIDDEVVDIMRTEERLMAILTSEPKIIDLTEKDYLVKIGWNYIEETGEFITNEIKEEDSQSSDSE
jgi:predicted nucleotidyltransferase